MLLGWETVSNAARRLLRMHLLDEVEDADARYGLPEGKTVEDIVDEVMKGSPEKVHFVMGKWKALSAKGGETTPASCFITWG